MKGLRARGGFLVDQEWREGRLVSATITSTLGRPVFLRYGGETRALTIAKDRAYVFTP